MKMAENSLHQGVVFNGTTGGGGGSATFMGDLEFTGGNIGVSQQNISFFIKFGTCGQWLISMVRLDSIE